MVVHGEPGLDEISPLGITHVREAHDGAVQAWTIDPSAHGLSVSDPEELAGGDPAANAAVIEAVLQGRGTPGARAAVLLNAAAAWYVSRDDVTYADAVRAAEAALDRGDGWAALERLRVASRAAHAAHRGDGSAAR
jgi:anthranilate phosphoribosyltransferase